MCIIKLELMHLNVKVNFSTSLNTHNFKVALAALIQE
jgi:hypothetical protein